MTQITAALSWYDEHPDHLAALTANFAEHGITRLVALDGAYQHYPDAKPTTSPTQAQAIRDTAQRHGIHATIHVPDRPWPSEIHKRTSLFRHAHQHSRPGDWTWILDADEQITASDGLDQLHATPCQVAEVLVYEGSPDNHIDPRPLRMLYQHQPTGIHVEQHHARYVTGDGTTLWDPTRPDEQAAAHSLLDVRVWHKPEQRAAQRLQDRETYYETVVAEKLERY